MTLIRESQLKIQELPVEKLGPNPLIPNRMSDAMVANVRAYIEREGCVEPIIVRPRDQGYEILGGFHLWKVAQDLDMKTVPCVVVKLDDRRAKVLSINLNE